jgi:predicted dehydrogenase
LTAIAAGKRVLVEKPLATTSADGQQLIEAAEQHGVELMVGHTFEYDSAVWKLRDLVHECREQRIAMLVTHDPELVRACTRVIRVAAGRLLPESPAAGAVG